MKLLRRRVRSSYMCNPQLEPLLIPLTTCVHQDTRICKGMGKKLWHKCSLNQIQIYEKTR